MSFKKWLKKSFVALFGLSVSLGTVSANDLAYVVYYNNTYGSNSQPPRCGNSECTSPTKFSKKGDYYVTFVHDENLAKNGIGHTQAYPIPGNSSLTLRCKTHALRYLVKCSLNSYEEKRKPTDTPKLHEYMLWSKHDPADSSKGILISKKNIHCAIGGENNSSCNALLGSKNLSFYYCNECGCIICSSHYNELKKGDSKAKKEEQKEEEILKNSVQALALQAKQDVSSKAKNEEQKKEEQKEHVCCPICHRGNLYSIPGFLSEVEISNEDFAETKKKCDTEQIFVDMANATCNTLCTVF